MSAPSDTNKPINISTQLWSTSRRLRQAWLTDDDGITIENCPYALRSVANLDRLFSDAADTHSPAGSAAHCTDYAAQLEKTWPKLEESLRIGDWGLIVERLPESSSWTIPSPDVQLGVLLDLFATLPQSIDVGMRDALTGARQLRSELSDTAIRLREISDSLTELCELHGMDYPKVSHVGDLAHEIVDTLDSWEPVPPFGQKFAEIGNGNAGDASSLVRHFDERLSAMLGVSLPPDFAVGDTDLARIINALLRRPAITSQGILKARRLSLSADCNCNT